MPKPTLQEGVEKLSSELNALKTDLNQYVSVSQKGLRRYFSRTGSKKNKYIRALVDDLENLITQLKTTKNDSELTIARDTFEKIINDANNKNQKHRFNVLKKLRANRLGQILNGHKVSADSLIKELDNDVKVRSIIATEDEFKEETHHLIGQFKNPWESRALILSEEINLVAKIAPKLMEFWKADSEKLIEIINCIHTDRARLELFQHIYQKMEEKDVNFIGVNVNDIIRCFRSSDEFLATYEKMAKKISSEAANDYIEKYHAAVNEIMKMFHRHEKSEENVANTFSHQELSVIGSDRRYLIWALKHLTSYAEKVTLCEKLSSQLDNLLCDRYDWFNFLITCCSNKNDVRNVGELIDAIFQQNLRLAAKFDAGQLKQNINAAFNKIENTNNNFAYQFSNYLGKKLFSSHAESIEKTNVHEAIVKNIPHERKGKLIRKKTMIFTKDMLRPYTEKEKEQNEYKRYFQLAEMGRYCRIGNINFIASGSWCAERYNVDTEYLQKKDNIVEDVLQHLEGYDPTIDKYKPYTIGNCYDQARMELIYLATRNQGDSTLNGKTVLQISSPHADYGYLIITSLTIKQLQQIPINHYGRIDLLEIWRLDKKATLIDAGRMTVFHHGPQEGLHYAVFPHNDDSQPSVKDPTGVTVNALCTIGDANTMTIFDYHHKIDINGKREIDKDGIEIIEHNANIQAAKNFIEDVKHLSSDPRWQLFCDRLESLPAPAEKLKTFFESSNDGVMALDDYPRAM